MGGTLLLERDIATAALWECGKQPRHDFQGPWKQLIVQPLLPLLGQAAEPCASVSRTEQRLTEFIPDSGRSPRRGKGGLGGMRTLD